MGVTASRQLGKYLGFSATFNSPATLSKSIDETRGGGLQRLEISTVRMYVTRCSRVDDDGRWVNSWMCTVCSNLRVVRRQKWVAIEQGIMREVCSIYSEAFLELTRWEPSSLLPKSPPPPFVTLCAFSSLLTSFLLTSAAPLIHQCHDNLRYCDLHICDCSSKACHNYGWPVQE